MKLKGEKLITNYSLLTTHYNKKRSGNPKATQPILAENLDKMRDFKQKNGQPKILDHPTSLRTHKKDRTTFVIRSTHIGKFQQKGRVTRKLPDITANAYKKWNFKACEL